MQPMAESERHCNAGFGYPLMRSNATGDEFWR